MPDTWGTFGHDHIKNLLGRQLAGQKFSHAYLFRGPAGVGKRFLALEFAKKLLQTGELANHPDFEILDSAGEITLEQALAFSQRLSLKPFVAKKKVFVINHAQNLNSASGNALLKNLEEPSADTIIILVAEGAVLPTIFSRCLVLNFNPFSDGQIAEFAKYSKISVGPEHISLSYGRSARLKLLAEDQGFYQQEKQRLNSWEKLQKAKTAEKLAAVSEYGLQESEALAAMLGSWLGFALRTNPEAKPLSALLEAALGLKANFNKKLVLQKLFLSI
jgi:DNA polymerase III delta prime subunit